MSLGERTGLSTADRDTSDRVAVTQKRDGHDAPIGNYLGKGRETIGGVRLHVGNLHNGPPQDCPANRGVLTGGPGICLPPGSYTLWSEAIPCGGAEKLSIKSKDGRKLCLTEPPSALGDRIEHAFQRELRAADDLKQLGRGTLSLMRFSQLSLKLRDPAVKVLLCPGS